MEYEKKKYSFQQQFILITAKYSIGRNVMIENTKRTERKENKFQQSRGLGTIPHRFVWS